VVTLCPPLTVSSDELERALGILGSAATGLTKRLSVGS
jgi:4-aminobutyrate aminotransferase-like enzyme